MSLRCMLGLHEWTAVSCTACNACWVECWRCKKCRDLDDKLERRGHQKYCDNDR